MPPLFVSERLILRLLLDGGREMYGLDLIKASGGQLRLGSIYVTLDRMARKGLVESHEETRATPNVGIARSLYRITAFGAKVLRAYETTEVGWARLVEHHE
jgi:DNA-binding PadR family transcriptional regulator